MDIPARILVYGAGPLGSLFASRLQQGGNDVSILARGERLAQIREHGIVIVDSLTGVEEVTFPRAVVALDPEDAYDLVLVVIRKNHALQILPALAANRHTPNVLFLMNNAVGPDALVEALGEERVLIGFPGSAGYREGHVVHVLTGNERERAPVPFGEADGHVDGRTEAVARIIESAPGLMAEIRSDMDAWLKYHAALLFPTLAPCLHAAGADNYRLARTRDLLILAIRGIREAFRVLGAVGLPVTPQKLRLVQWVPEPILVPVAARLLSDPMMETALVRHAAAAHDEVQHLIGEFMALARTTTVPTPVIDYLLTLYGPDAPEIPDGSAEIPLHWSGMLALMAGLVASVSALAALLRACGRRGR